MTSNSEWLSVESLDLEGQGVAHNSEGKVVFIEGALPGEEVQVNVGRSKNAWEQGHMTALRRESSQRVRPGCPHLACTLARVAAARCSTCTAQPRWP